LLSVSRVFSDRSSASKRGSRQKVGDVIMTVQRTSRTYLQSIVISRQPPFWQLFTTLAQQVSACLPGSLLSKCIRHMYVCLCTCTHVAAPLHTRFFTVNVQTTSVRISEEALVMVRNGNPMTTRIAASLWKTPLRPVGLPCILTSTWTKTAFTGRIATNINGDRMSQTRVVSMSSTSLLEIKHGWTSSSLVVPVATASRYNTIKAMDAQAPGWRRKLVPKSYMVSWAETDSQLFLGKCTDLRDGSYGKMRTPLNHFGYEWPDCSAFAKNGFLISKNPNDGRYRVFPGSIRSCREGENCTNPIKSSFSQRLGSSCIVISLSVACAFLTFFPLNSHM